jgi:hypothetical protein
MYNGQFAKGIVHLAIFAVLVSLSDNVNGIFALFVAGWIFYMVFEAYHTAVARRDGLPLPNAFGFNDIGERMGFGKSWGVVGTARPAGNGAPQTPPSPAPVVLPPIGWATFRRRHSLDRLPLRQPNLSRLHNRALPGATPRMQRPSQALHSLTVRPRRPRQCRSRLQECDGFRQEPSG